MDAMQRFLRRQAKRVARAPTLDQALLTDHPWRYARYRLRYTFPRALLRTALHGVEIALFARVVWPEILVYFLVVRSATALWGGLWWGALETLREDVRALPVGRRATQLPQLVQGWLGVAAGVSGLQVLALLAWLRWGPSPFSSFSVLDAYAIACVAGSVLRTVVTAYHAGIFALRRVHRPPWAILGPDVIELAAVLLMYEWLGAWSFAAALLAMAVLRACLRVVLSRRAYHQAGYALTPWMSWTRSVRRLQLRGRATGIAAFANLATQLDAWLILGLAAAPSTTQGGLVLAATLHVLRPLLAAGADWARLFYFDFARLALQYSALLRARFSRFAARVSWVVAALTGLLGYAVLGAFPDRLRAPSVLLALACFIVARARFSLDQVQAFAYGRRVELTVVTLLLMVAAAATIGLPLERPLWLIGVAALFLLASVWLGRRGARVVPRLAAGSGSRHVPLPRWLYELSRAQGPLVLWVADVDAETGRVPRVLEALYQAYPDGSFVRIGRRRIAWWHDARADDARARERRAWLVTGGCLRRLRCLRDAPYGSAALRHAITYAWLGERLSQQLQGTAVDEATLIARFASRFPDGWVLDVRSRARLPRRKEKQAARHIRRALDRVVADRPPAQRDASVPGVSAYCPAGEPRILFMVDAGAPHERRIEWAELVRTASLRASIHGVGRSATKSR